MNEEIKTRINNLGKDLKANTKYLIEVALKDDDKTIEEIKAALEFYKINVKLIIDLIERGGKGKK